MEKIEFTRIMTQDYGNLSFSLTNMKRGQVSPKENLSYPDFYLDMVDSHARTAGSIYFQEDDENPNKTTVFFYPDSDIVGLSTQSIGALNKYINFLQKNYKQLKNLK